MSRMRRRYDDTRHPEMRSGQYKLSSPKGGGGDEAKISVSYFRSSCMDLPPLLNVNPSGGQLPLDLSIYHLATLKREDEKAERKETTLKNLKEQLFKFDKQREGGLRQHRSCENVSVLSRGKVNRVEQKVRSLLLRGEPKKRGENVFMAYGDLGDLFDGGWKTDLEESKADLWQAGKIVTTSRKSRLSGAYSHSALHTLNASSDTASCLSASSGYSSSSSSSYGSFKSSASVCSTLPRNSNNSPGSQSPNADNTRLLFVDNPLYDITPASANGFPDIARSSGDPSGLESLSSGEFSLGDGSSPHFPGPFEDPFAKQCKEYFERRLQSSESLRRKWSLYVPEPKFPERDKHIDSELISKGDAIIDSKFNGGFGSEMSFGAESNFIPPEEPFETANEPSRNQLDVKMEFLRQEIASLIQQDNSLFRQLLALHDSISTLKLQNALGHAHPNNHPALRPLTPSDLDSFTEEEEEEEEDEEEEEEVKERGEDEGESEGRQEKAETHGGNRNRQEGRRISVTQTVEEESPSDTEEKSYSIREEETRSHENKKDIEDDEDEGHGTDLSIGHTPSHSPSPASTLSSNSSKDSSYFRSLYSEMNSDFSGSFTRCRKSYAPNARNRRRASSVHRQKSAQLDCGTTTALVVVHADDEDALLNSNRPRAHSFTPLTVFASHAVLSYSQSNGEGKGVSSGSAAMETKLFPSPSPSKALSVKNKRNDKEKNNSHSKRSSVSSCSSQTATASPLCVASRSNLAHPPYREALIM